MRTVIILFFVLLASAFGHTEQTQAKELSTQAQNISVISILVPPDVYDDYQVFMQGRSPEEIQSFSGERARRDVVELVILQQALTLGGLTTKINFKISPTYLRTKLELQLGNVTIVGNTMWISDLEKFKDELYISKPVIADGNFEAGLYTSIGNTKAMSASTLEDVQALSAISNKNWTPDWSALSQLNLSELHHSQKWDLMVRTVSQKRIDFLLAPFQQTPDMLLHVDDVILTPIHGIKLTLKGSRHFAVSKNNPQGHKTFKALEKGLEILTKNGTIDKAYQQCGFFHESVQDWKSLN